MTQNGKRLILVTNDDGYMAQGIGFLAGIMERMGETVVVAPDSARSGAACGITSTCPVSVRTISNNVYACSGTPTDCVKIALEKILPRRPDLVVSGVNHGDNASVSLHYSGTVGAALEACMKRVPAIAYSLRTRNKECDFRPYAEAIEEWASRVLIEGLPDGTCLNINFPEVEKLSGTCICRMARGTWHTEWQDAGIDKEGKNLYTLTGTFINLEPEASDTDYWALDHGMAAVTPVSLDVTDYTLLDRLIAGGDAKHQMLDNNHAFIRPHSMFV